MQIAIPHRADSIAGGSFPERSKTAKSLLFANFTALKKHKCTENLLCCQAVSIKLLKTAWKCTPEPSIRTCGVASVGFRSHVFVFVRKGYGVGESAFGWQVKPRCVSLKFVRRGPSVQEMKLASKGRKGRRRKQRQEEATADKNMDGERGRKK
jgi:hypothetical protein